jgi:hypothetical protein
MGNFACQQAQLGAYKSYLVASLAIQIFRSEKNVKLV